MAWQKVYEINSSQSGEAFLIKHSFKKSTLLIKAEPTPKKNTWHKAGLFYPIATVPGIGEVTFAARKIYLETQIVTFSYVNITPFQAKFYLYHWFHQITLTFWEKEYTDEEKLESSYKSKFTQQYLNSESQLIVTHDLSGYPANVLVYDNFNKVVNADDIYSLDLNTFLIDLSSFAPIPGTWRIFLAL